MKALSIITLTLMTHFVFAQLTPWKDFETSDEVSVVSTIKVSENMINYYLEGLNKTWIPAMKFQKEKGYIKDYKLFVSDLPNSGDFNVINWITYENDAAARGSQARFEEVQAHLNTLSSEDERETVVREKYPNLREIVGQYRIREVTIKK